MEKTHTVKSSASYAAVQIGLKRPFHPVENVLSDTMKKEFERRFDEGYNIEDNTYAGTCWKYTKAWKICQMKQGNLKLHPMKQKTSMFKRDQELKV